MSGDATIAQIASFMIALKMRGETASDIAAGASQMRANAHSIKAPNTSIDIVGTGGDGANSLNISTAAAIIVAGCGVPVAKHGNKAVSSKSGAANILPQSWSLIYFYSILGYFCVFLKNYGITPIWNNSACKNTNQLS